MSVALCSIFEEHLNGASWIMEAYHTLRWDLRIFVEPSSTNKLGDEREGTGTVTWPPSLRSPDVWISIELKYFVVSTINANILLIFALGRVIRRFYFSTSERRFGKSSSLFPDI